MPDGYATQEEWIELPFAPIPEGKQFFRFTIKEP
jgi:hypothetical protein